MVYFHILAGSLIFCLLAWQLVWPLRKKKVLFGGLLVFLAVMTFKFPVVRLLGGRRFFAPELPGWLLHFFGFLYGWVLISFFCILISATVFGAWYVICRLCKRPPLPRKWVRRVQWGIAGAAGLLALAALWGGIKAPEVQPVPLTFKDLPAAAHGMRIAVLSDIHAGPTVREARVREFVRIANETRPDLVVILGDFLDGTVEEVGKDLKPLGELKAPHGILAVTGNHEYYYDYTRWREFFAGLGIKMLENSNVPVGNTGLRVAGITDPAGRKFGEPAPNLKKALAGAGKHFTILLAHRPKFAAEAAKRGAKIQLSGHTHGGTMIGLQPIIRRYNAGFVSGRYQVGNMLLVVSNGTGIWNGMPLRLGPASEILLLELRRSAE